MLCGVAMRGMKMYLKRFVYLFTLSCMTQCSHVTQYTVSDCTTCMTVYVSIYFTFCVDMFYLLCIPMCLKFTVVQ